MIHIYNIYFLGEEPLLSAKLWTNGWDIYYPNKISVYHLYNTPTVAVKRNLHSEDNPIRSDLLESNSKKRFKHLLGMEESTDTEVLKEIDKYGMGKERSFEDYQIFCGVNFKNRTVEERTKRGEFKK